MLGHRIKIENIQKIHIQKVKVKIHYSWIMMPHLLEQTNQTPFSSLTLICGDEIHIQDFTGLNLGSDQHKINYDSFGFKGKVNKKNTKSLLDILTMLFMGNHHSCTVDFRNSVFVD